MVSKEGVVRGEHGGKWLKNRLKKVERLDTILHAWKEVGTFGQIVWVNRLEGDRALKHASIDRERETI